MTTVRAPILLNKQLTEKARLRATAGNLELSVSALPKAALTLEIKQDALPEVHDFVWIYTERGNAGLFRVVSSNFNYAQTLTVQLLGAADTLSDDVYNETASESLTKTAAQWLALILAKQTTVRWQLGVCELNCQVEIKPNYQDLWSLMETIRETRTGYYWTYDFTTSPWTISLRQMPDTIASEFRITRNVESAQISISDQDLCNQLVFTVTDTVDGEGNPTPPVVYNHAESQAKYGVRTRCTDIKTDEIPLGLTAQQYALQMLNEHANPVSSITINGADLHNLTGDDFDNITLGSLCRAVLPDYGDPLEERVVSLKWPDIYGTPEKIVVSMATEIESLTGGLASAKQLAAAVKAASRGGGGGGGKADRNRPISLVLTETIEAVEGVGINQLWQSGIVIDDAQTGVKIFSLYNGLESIKGQIKVTNTKIEQEVTRAEGAEGNLSGRIDVEAGKIGLIVEGTDGNYHVSRASIVAAINTGGTSSVQIDADQIALNGQTLATLLAAQSIDCAGLHASQALSIEAANGFSYQTQTVKWGTIQVDGVDKAEYLGTGETVNFDRAAARAEGAAAVGLALDTANHQVKVNTSGGDKAVTIGVTKAASALGTDHKYTVVFAAKIGDSTMATDTWTSDDQAYQDGLSAGASTVTISGGWANADTGNTNSYIVRSTNGQSSTGVIRIDTGTWSGGNRSIKIYDSLTGGTSRAHATVSMPSNASWSSSRTSQSNLRVTCTVGGKSYSSDFGV